MPKNNRTHLQLILMLGSLTALSPFTIDMYLPAFPQMAQFFRTDVAQVSLTLSSYFIGLASGQLIYGPLMDRFGRKKPLLIGLALYILASLGCALTPTIEALIFLRFIQAIGGCAASVGAFAMVRDLFGPKESAKVFSSLILILGTSPLLAPTVGGYLSLYFGWSSVFYVLAIGAGILWPVLARFLQESHGGDRAHVLRPIPILKNYLSILREPNFYAYGLAGAVGFSGLFVYLAASPTIFMEIFHVSEQAYGWIFALIAMGMIGTSQINVILLKRFNNEQILLGALISLVILSSIFFISAYNGWLNIYGVVAIMFCYLSMVGLSNPNSSALAMAPFGAKAGSAAAMVGFSQMACGSMASVCVGILKAQSLVPITAVFIGTSILALMIFMLGGRRVVANSN